MVVQMDSERTLRRRRSSKHEEDSGEVNEQNLSETEHKELEVDPPIASALFRMCCIYMFIAFLIFALLSTLFLSLMDSPIDSASFSLPVPPRLVGPLERNSALDDVKRLMENHIYGPESFAVHRSFGTIYSGLRTGHIVEFKAFGENAFKIQRSVHLSPGADGSSCTGSYSSFPKCGRPLGLRFRKRNEDSMLIADAYHGLYELNVVTGDFEVILKPGTPITGDFAAKPLQHLNDVDEMADGVTIILSEPSTKFSDRDCLYAMAEHRGDGRLLSYNVLTGELKILVDGLQYPNGVQIEANSDCVLFAEMGNARILRHCLNSSVPYTVVIDNLPGYPDNIRLSNDGKLWVPLGDVRLEDDSWITRRPWIRNLLAKMTSYGSLQWLLNYLSPRYGMALLVDPASGEILRSLHDSTGDHISSISQVEELRDGSLIFGGDENTFIGVLSKKEEVGGLTPPWEESIILVRYQDYRNELTRLPWYGLCINSIQRK